VPGSATTGAGGAAAQRLVTCAKGEMSRVNGGRFGRGRRRGVEALRQDGGSERRCQSRAFIPVRMMDSATPGSQSAHGA
jgi:hypothetical protein